MNQKVLTLVCMVLALASGALGQTFQTTAGGGTLFNAQGGIFQVYMPDGSIYEFSGGVIQGQVVYGFNVTKWIHGIQATVGDSEIQFPLATDFNPSGYGFYTRGATLHKKTKRQEITVFGGFVNTQYVLPFVLGAQPHTPIGVISYHLNLSDKWAIESHDVFEGRQTMIQSIIFNPWRAVKLAASAGVGSNSPYGAASLNLDTRRLTIRGSYSTEGSDFRRIISPLYVTSENDHGNIDLTLRPVNGFQLRGDHENFSRRWPPARALRPSRIASVALRA